MAAVLIEVAQAMTELMEKADFGIQPWKPERSYADWDEKLSELSKLHVDLIPNQSAASELATQDSVKYMCPVDIGIRKLLTNDQQMPCGTLNVDEIDRLVLLVEQVHEFWLKQETRRLPTYELATWYETNMISRFNRKHLRENRQFTGLIRVTYEVIRQL